MADDPQILEMLLDWEEGRRHGRPVSPEDLCRECPELLPRLRDRIRLLISLDTALDLSAFEEPQSRGSAPSLTVPGYEILSELGRGGMGVVYKARQIGLDRLVALKMILAGKEASPAERARFEAEAKAAAKLNHPQIVHIYEIGERDGCPYFSMEYLPGGNLEEMLRGRPLPPRHAAALVEGLARAVHYAHLLGIVHRDLKPANILVVAGGGWRVPGEDKRAGSVSAEAQTLAHPATHHPLPVTKIADFGLARNLGAARHTRPGTIVGTPAFMAPEQARGDDEQIGPRSDVYSLGAILFQLLTGRPPFEGKSEWQVIEDVLHRPPPPPRQFEPGTPPELETVCLHCLAKAPGQRYPSAEALADDLRRYRDGQRVVPMPPTVLREAAGSLQEGRRIAVAGIVLLTALLVPGILFVLQALPSSWTRLPPGPPLALGILRPTAGPLFDEAAAMVEAALLAVDEVNAHGGVLGREVRVVFFDLGTERDRIPEETLRQMGKEPGIALLGCVTPQGRETLAPVLKGLDSLLLYPGPADGTSSSGHVVSLRPTPAQSVLPVVDWLCKERAKKHLFLAGSDSVYPRVAFEMLRQHLAKAWPNVDVVGEVYLPENQAKTRRLVDAIPKGKEEPDVILNLLHDDATLDLLREVRAADFRAVHTPVVTLRGGGKLLRNLSQVPSDGQYLAGCFFPGLPDEANQQFLKRLRAKYGDARPQDDLAASAYVGVHLWAQAARAAGTAEPAAVLEAIRGLSFDGPAGPVVVDAEGGYCRPVVRLVRVEPQARFHVLHTWSRPAHPEPYFGHPKREWDFFREYWLRNWSDRAGPRRWFNPGNKRILPIFPDEAAGEGS
jgi:serine/threonine protein kinase